MSDDPVDLGTSKTNAVFTAQVKSGASLPTAFNVAVTAGGTAAGVAACAATGVGAVAAPLCGLLGGLIGKFLGTAASAVEHFFSQLFTSAPPPPILITPNDAVPDPGGASGMYLQLGQADYLLARQLADAVTALGGMVQNFGGIPDEDKILAALAPSLGLVPNSGQWYNFVGADASSHPDFWWDGAYAVPSLKTQGDAVIKSTEKNVTIAGDPLKVVWNSSGLSYSGGPYSAAAPTQSTVDALKALLQGAVAWSQALQVETTRQLALMTTDAMVRSAYSTTRAPMADPVAAANLIKLWWVLEGVAGGVQFVKPHDEETVKTNGTNGQTYADNLIALSKVLRGETSGVQFIRPRSA